MPRLGLKKSRTGCAQCRARRVKVRRCPPTTPRLLTSCLFFRHWQCDEKRPCTHCARHRQACSLVNVLDVAQLLSAQPAPSPKLAVSPKHALPWTQAAAHASASASTSCASTPAAEAATPGAHSAASPAALPTAAMPAATATTAAAAAAAAAPAAAPTATAANPPSTPFHSPRAGPSSASAAPPTFSSSPNDVWRRDLMLLHHYTTWTADTLLPKGNVHGICQIVLPELAYKHDFIMHGILAISALHIAAIRADESQYYSTLSIHHHNQALASYQDALSRLANENFVPVFALALILPIWTVKQSVTGLPGRPAADPIAGILDCFNLIRGSGRIAWNAAYLEDFGPLAPVIELEPDEGTLPVHLSARLDELNRLITLEFLDANELPAYKEAVDELRKEFARSVVHPTRTTLNPPMRWMVSVPDEYMVGIKHRKPVALVILAYFAVLLHRFNSFWFLDQAGARLVECISGALEGPWAGWVQWPRDHTRDMFVG